MHESGAWRCFVKAKVKLGKYKIRIGRGMMQLKSVLTKLHVLANTNVTNKVHSFDLQKAYGTCYYTLLDGVEHDIINFVPYSSAGLPISVNIVQYQCF